MSLDGALDLPKARDFGDKLEDLPEPTDAPPRPTTKGYRKRILGVALWQWLPFIVILYFAFRLIGWPVLAILAAAAVFLWLSFRRMRQ